MQDNKWIIDILTQLTEKKQNLDSIGIGMESDTYYEITCMINSCYKLAKGDE